MVNQPGAVEPVFRKLQAFYTNPVAVFTPQLEEHIAGRVEPERRFLPAGVLDTQRIRHPVQAAKGILPARFNQLPSLDFVDV